MERLLTNLTGLSLRESTIWYNNTNYELYCIADEWEDKVYTNERIEAGSLIGMIEGEIIGTRNRVVDKYCLWLNDYEIMDCRSLPRCILSMTREGFYIGTEANCKLGLSYTSEVVTAYVYALRQIEAGEELFMDRDFY